MKNFSIPRKKWIEVYNSIILLFFFIDEYKNNIDSFQKVNEKFNKYCNQNKIIGEGFNLLGGDNLLFFGYLVIVRTFEIIAFHIGGNIKQRNQFYEWIIEKAKEEGFTSFDDIIRKFNITIKTFAYGGKSDEEKLYQLFRHIRHSLSHFSYETNTSTNEIDLKSVDLKSQNVKLEMIIPMHNMLGLTAYFGRWVNNTLHRENLLL